MLTSRRVTRHPALWLAMPIGVAVSVIAWTPAFAGYFSATNCIGGWTRFSCATIEGPPVDAYVRHVPEPFSEADRARAAERDGKWVARCRPVIVQDGYGVPRYHYAAPGCEFGVNKD